MYGRTIIKTKRGLIALDIYACLRKFLKKRQNFPFFFSSKVFKLIHWKLSQTKHSNILLSHFLLLSNKHHQTIKFVALPLFFIFCCSCFHSKHINLFLWIFTTKVKWTILFMTMSNNPPSVANTACIIINEIG